MLLAASLIFAVILLEVLVRVFDPQITYSTARRSSPMIYEKSDYLPFVLKPNAKDRHIGVYGDFNVSIAINSYGLRDYERPVLSNAKRILVMGDSMTFGFGVEMNETYSKYLERKLNSKGSKYEVFNAGWADGYSLDSYYLYLKNDGIKKFKPDVIIVEFFVYNDITDISLNRWVNDSNGLPIKITSPYYDVDGQNRLRSAKRVLPLLKNSIVQGIYESLLARSNLFVLIKSTISNMLTVSSANRVFDKQYNPDIQNEWEINENVLLAIKGIADKNNAKLLVVVMPVNFQVNDNLWNEYSASIGAGKLSRTKPDDLMKKFGSSHGIKVIDVYDSFHEEYKKEPLFLRIDGHFNPEGHKLVADDIYNYLQQLQ